MVPFSKDSVHPGKCDLCQQEMFVKWNSQRNKWVCDACEAHYFCVECGQPVLPEEVFADEPFGLYMAVICKKCAENRYKGQSNKTIPE
jgi:hypothetical protein